MLCPVSVFRWTSLLFVKTGRFPSVIFSRTDKGAKTLVPYGLPEEAQYPTRLHFSEFGSRPISVEGIEPEFAGFRTE